MRVRKLLYATTLAASVIVAASSRGEYTATTGPDTVVNTPGAPAIGSTFSVTDGHFTSYVATPSSPQITGNDLPLYSYDLSGTITMINGLEIDYSGNFDIKYDNAGTFLTVSSGFTKDLKAVFDPSGLSAVFSGVLVQTGKYGPPFGDLGPASNFLGAYSPNLLDGGATGTVAGTLNGPTATPLPKTATAGLGLLALVGVVHLRRRNAVTC